MPICTGIDDEGRWHRMALDVAHLGDTGMRPEPEDLACLLARRAALRDHEEELSYWRRILQARVDVLRARLATEDEEEALRQVLGDERRPFTRAAHVVIRPYRDMLELATCDMLWEKSCDSRDEELLLHALDRMVVAEKWISHTRARVFRELDLATEDLKARLCQDPTEYLSIVERRSLASAG
jgi:hypothetical protein